MGRVRECLKAAVQSCGSQARTCRPAGEEGLREENVRIPVLFSYRAQSSHGLEFLLKARIHALVVCSMILCVVYQQL